LSAASAADLPTRKEAPVYVAPVPVFSWTGFYIGANLGAAFGTSSSTISGSAPFYTGFINPLGIPTGSYGNSGASFVGGGQAGYNYQIGSAVIGVETDLEWMNLGRSGTFTTTGVLPGGFGSVNTYVGSRMDWLGTTRLRVGFTPWDRMLIYGTGGFAYGGGVVNGAVTGNGPLGAAWLGTNSGARFGWSLGAGGEYAITNNVTFRAEYLYYDLGSMSETTTPNAVAAAYAPGAFMTSSTKFQGSLVRLGINYKF
jgi:outer membrane immunogenic protein